MFFQKSQAHLQNASHFVGVAYPPNRFSVKSVRSCKHDSHFCQKICLTLNENKKNYRKIDFRQLCGSFASETDQASTQAGIFAVMLRTFWPSAVMPQAASPVQMI